MSFYYGIEKSNFDEKWETLRQQYLDLGMSEKDINAIFQYDWNVLKGERIYRQHNQSFLPECFDEDDSDNDKSSCLQKFIIDEESAFSLSDLSPYGWIDDLDNPELAKCIKHLSKMEIDILTLLQAGYNQQEIGLIFHVTQQAISKRISHIRKKLENFRKKVVK